MVKQSKVDPRKEMLMAIDSVAKRGGISRDKAITAWYASTLMGIDEDEAIDAASVDGPEDSGCDFIYIDDDQRKAFGGQNVWRDMNLIPLKHGFSMTSFYNVLMTFL